LGEAPDFPTSFEPVSNSRADRGDERRADIVVTARAALIEHGLDRFSMRQVAESLGMKLGNLQYYFATRDDLLEAVVRAEFASDQAAATDRGGSDASRELADVVEMMLTRWTTSERDIYLTVGVLALHDERFAAVLHEIYQAFYAQIAALVSHIDPTATKLDATARAMLITSLVDGAALQHYAPSGKLAKQPIARHIVSLALDIAQHNRS
jgi:AcrR family transcriptional regulator